MPLFIPDDDIFDSQKIFYEAQILLNELVRFDTTSDKSNKECVSFLKGYFEELGIPFEILKSADGLQDALLVSVGNVDSSSLLCVAHTDCVPVTGQNWASDPFQLHIRHKGVLGLFTKEDAQRRAEQKDLEGEFVARGATDNKQSVAVLAAMAKYVSRMSPDLGINFRFALTAREETSMEGAKLVVDEFYKQGLAPKGIWVLEPTPLVLEHNSSLEFSTVVHGISCHSSEQGRGVNAIDLAWAFLNESKESIAGLVKKHPGTIANIPATIQGGTSVNTVPGNCSITWQVRGAPEITAQGLLDRIKVCSEKVLRPYAKIPEVNIVTEILSDIPGFSQTADSDFVRLFKEVSGQDKIEPAGFTTEAGIMKKLGKFLGKDIPVVAYGTKHYETAHAPNESLAIKDLYNLTRDMQKILLRSKALSPA